MSWCYVKLGSMDASSLELKFSDNDLIDETDWHLVVAAPVLDEVFVVVVARVLH